ncbi:DUF6985 domain-containing protein [Tenacibaculum amylolyticum]|uniref:DUF6985 domain-containing protein n=1 Tax=Tenacibaculum amylolyticum TaxID=104269 RepID=UPI003896708B
MKTNTVNSNIIGILRQNDDFNDWWESNLIIIPFFNNQEIKITFMDFVPENDPEFIKDADTALQLFLTKSESDKFDISKLVYKNCMDFLNAVVYDEDDQALWDIKNPNDIWNFVQPTHIFVTRRDYEDQSIYININCECDWEQEHGLQLVFKQGKHITRVSSIDGHLTNADAYGIPDEEDYLLKQFERIERYKRPKWWQFWK